MTAIYCSKEEIEKAREIDLLTYLRLNEPENLVRLNGDAYCTRQHDSLKISNGKWMWWSRGFGGSSALDYLTKVKGVSFSDAAVVTMVWSYIGELAGAIIGTYVKGLMEAPAVEDLSLEFEDVKNMLQVQVVEANRNMDSLKDLIYKII